MPSTRDPSTLPEVGTLRQLSQSLAMLDAILRPEWEYRYHSFNANWSAGKQMASMRNGSGDEYFILFSKAGAIMKGFAPRSEAWRRTLRRGQPWAGLFDGVPGELAGFLEERPFSIADTTFCLWRRPSDPTWQTGTIEPLDGKDPDGSSRLLRLLDGDPDSYRAWAEDYFETAVPLLAVEQVYAHRPLTEEMVTTLNPGLSLSDLAEDVSEIGYPMSS